MASLDPTDFDTMETILGSVHMQLDAACQMAIPADWERETRPNTNAVDDLEKSSKSASRGRVRTRLSRLGQRMRPAGVEVETAWAALQRASEALLLIQPAETVVAQIPDLRAELKARLRSEDVRFDEYLRDLDRIERSVRRVAGVADPPAGPPPPAAPPPPVSPVGLP